jgi:hypothetical protein
MRQLQRGRGTFRRLPTLVLDILRWQRISLVVPFPPRRSVFILSLPRGSDVLLILCHFSPISLQASRVDRLGILRRLAAFLRAQHRWRADLTQSINASEVHTQQVVVDGHANTDPASAAARLALWVVPMPQRSCGRTRGQCILVADKYEIYSFLSAKCQCE